MATQIAIDIMCRMLACHESELDLELVRRIELIDEMINRIDPESCLRSTQAIASIIECYLREFPGSNLHDIAKLKHTQWTHWPQKK